MDTLFYWTGVVVWSVVLLIVLGFLLGVLYSRYEERRVSQHPTPPSPAERFERVLAELRKHDFVAAAVDATGDGDRARVVLSNAREVFVHRVRHVPDRAFEVRYRFANGGGSEPCKGVDDVVRWLEFFAKKAE